MKRCKPHGVFPDFACTICHEKTGEKIRPLKKPSVKVNNLANFEFWLGMFKTRTVAWQKANLKRLSNGKSIFDTEDERQDKIKALRFLLNE